MSAIGTTLTCGGYALTEHHQSVADLRGTREMSIGEIASVVVVIFLVLVIGNIVFSFLAERKNPPIGNFIECDGVRLHYLERGDRGAPCVVLFHGNGSLI